MPRTKILVLVLTGNLIFDSTLATAETVIAEPLNLRQGEINVIADLAIESLGAPRPILTVKAYKMQRGSREAHVTFEPINLNGNSFEAESVRCQKRRTRWTCREPQKNRYYYEEYLSNSIALGEDVTPDIARELLRAAHGSGSTLSLSTTTRYIELGGESHVVRDSETVYSIYGWCDCAYEKTEGGFKFKNYHEILE